MQAINIVPGVPGTPISSVAGFKEQDPSIAQEFYLITGTTRDSTGNALGNCVAQLFRTTDSLYTAQTVSSGTGVFLFYVVNGVSYYIVAYLAGSPDVAGTTVNTLTGGQA